MKPILQQYKHWMLPQETSANFKQRHTHCIALWMKFFTVIPVLHTDSWSKGPSKIFFFFENCAYFILIFINVYSLPMYKSLNPYISFNTHIQTNVLFLNMSVIYKTKYMWNSIWFSVYRHKWWWYKIIYRFCLPKTL